MKGRHGATIGFCTAGDGVPMMPVFTDKGGALRPGTYRPFAVFAYLNHAGDFHAAAKALAARGYGGRVRTPGATLGGGQPSDDGNGSGGGHGGHGGDAKAAAKIRPEVLITADEYEANDAAARALGGLPDLYQRAGALVEVGTPPPEMSDQDYLRRPPGSRTVYELSPHLLRDRLTRAARFVRTRKTDGSEELVHCHPTGWLVAAVHAMQQWPGVRSLNMTAPHPVLLPSGKLLGKSGYHKEGGGILIDTPAALAVAVPDAPTKADAAAAMAALLDPVCDFPFAGDEDRAVYLSAVLTPLCWALFDGPAPLHLFDKNVRGAGGGLLADVVALTVTGDKFPVMTYTADQEELRKRGTAMVVAGDRMCLFDNVTGTFGGPVLAALLTGSLWKDRLLGVSKMAAGRLDVCWYATANNCQLRDDAARRVVRCRMDTDMERPETRGGFRHPDLRGHVRANRAALLSAALTMARAWQGTGRPQPPGAPLGSFEGWSDVVRGAILYAGGKDPAAGQGGLIAESDRDHAIGCQLVGAISELDHDRRGMSTAEMVRLVEEPGLHSTGAAAAFREAVVEMCGGAREVGKYLGYKLRHFKGRNFGGLKLDMRLVRGINRWSANRVPISAAGKPSPPCPPCPPPDAPGGGHGGHPGGVAKIPWPPQAVSAASADGYGTRFGDPATTYLDIPL